MSIEGGSGGSVGAASVSGPSFVAPAFEAVPIGGPLTTIVNEGPVGLADLKNTMPLQIRQSNPVSELRFNNPVKGVVNLEPLSAESAIAEAESILSQAKGISSPIATIVEMHGLIEPMVMPVAIPSGLEFPKPQVAASPFVESATKVENVLGTQAGSQQQVESLVKPRLEEQKIEEETVTERVTAKQADFFEEREIKRRKKFVVDKPVLARRLRQIGQAIQKALSMAERLGYGKKIIGWILGKSLVLANPEDLSQVVRPGGPDGTLSIIRETIKASQEFHSPEEVKAVVLGNRPVSLEEEGEPVSDEEVWKVFQDRTVKPVNKVTEIVEKRMVKKVQKPTDQDLGPSFTTETSKPQLGPTLEDLALAEVFPKAA